MACAGQDEAGAFGAADVTETPPEIPPAPASPNDGMTAQSVRVLALAVGGLLMHAFAIGPVPAAAIIPAFGVVAVWVYGLWERRKRNKQAIALRNLISDLTGGLIR